ncbi:Ov-16 antigen [Mycena indigotica]|uniref:Ov-16 antigen n=1 Tax=Mycena indigotica TaxID=2126181 RepID=A0A8H6SLB6_9AGAR|nr:Ov-16 antigen [Mycena indigotica]KAF7301865.1 Ov-16 antigen [Mycena indigotica]
MIHSLLFALPFLLTVSAVSTKDISTAFSQAGIIPNVVPIFDATAVLDVVYSDPSTLKPLTVTLGGNLTVQQTQTIPKFFVKPASGDQEYVVAFFDPDAPTPQNTSLAQFRHYVGGGYKAGSDGALTNNTPALTEYIGPGPPPGSDPHRFFLPSQPQHIELIHTPSYLILVFAQPSDFSAKAPSILNATTPRTNFNVTTFSAQLGLGAPITGTFWFTGPENPKDASSPSGTPTSLKGSSTAKPPPSAAPSSARHLRLDVLAAITGAMLAIVVALV